MGPKKGAGRQAEQSKAEEREILYPRADKMKISEIGARFYDAKRRPRTLDSGRGDRVAAKVRVDGCMDFCCFPGSGERGKSPAKIRFLQLNSASAMEAFEQRSDYSLGT